MKHPDARHLSIETQNYLRQQGIRLHEAGKQVCDISAYLGVSRSTVSKWWRQYQERGEAAFIQQARGRQVGDGRTLSPAMERDIEAALRDHEPTDWDIDSALWTRRAVQTLIDQRCQIKMPIRTVGEYLKRWGYSPQRPANRAYEQDSVAVETWLEEVYPAIAQRANAEGAMIHWEDESGVHSDEYGGRGYAPIGHTPEVHPTEKKREKVNYIATLDNQGTVRFMTYTCNFTGPVYIRFLERLADSSKDKVFLITDRHPVHLRKLVQQWFTADSAQIEVFYLPSYSPQLNPVEYLNNDLKQQVHDKPPTRSLKQLKERVISSLRKLQKLPAHVRNYFQHPDIAYAAA
jgi:transposase